jgi:hypothetical protein
MTMMHHEMTMGTTWEMETMEQQRNIMGMSLEHGNIIGMCSKHGNLFGNMYYSDFEDWKT